MTTTISDIKLETINPRWIDNSSKIPKFLKIKKSLIDKKGKGVFAKYNIKKGTFLGHYMGKISNDNKKGPYIFHTIINNKTVSIDATDINYSNWTRYMNCSINKENENIISYKLQNKEKYLIKNQYKSLQGYIVFYANRDIKKGEELLYYYGDYYAKLMNIKYNLKE